MDAVKSLNAFFFFLLLLCGLVPCSLPLCNVSVSFVTQILSPPLSLSLLMGKISSFAAPFLEEKKSLSLLLLLLPGQVYAWLAQR